MLKTFLGPVLLRCNKSVAFGLGSVSGPIRIDRDNRSAYQHALLHTLRDMVASLFTANVASHIDCYAQDPIYSDTDKAVLQRYGICPVDDPEGFLEVDQATAVISISPNIPVRGVIADLALPVVMIWDYVDFSEAPGPNR